MEVSTSRDPLPIHEVPGLRCYVHPLPVLTSVLCVAEGCRISVDGYAVDWQVVSLRLTCCVCPQMGVLSRKLQPCQRPRAAS